MAARKRRKQRAIRWAEIELEYLSHWHLSLRAIGRRHKIDQWTLWERARDGRWADRRREIIDAAMAEARQRAVSELSDAAAEGAKSLLVQLAQVRQRALRRQLEELETTGGLVDDVDTTSRTSKDQATGDTISRTVTKRRVRADGAAVAAAIQTEAKLLEALLGLAKPKEGEDTVDVV